MNPRRLPIVSIGGREFFRDERLREYRAVDNPHERVTFDEGASRDDSSSFVELTHAHLEEHYTVIINGNVYRVGVGCDGQAWITEDVWGSNAEEEAERAIEAVLAYRRNRKPLVPSWLDCKCRGAR